MTLLDVRTPAEFAALHVEGAVNRPLDRLDAAGLHSTLKADDTIYCICQTGRAQPVRSTRTARRPAFTTWFTSTAAPTPGRGAGLPVHRGG